MKKIVTMTAFVIITITSSYAGGNDVSKNVLDAFSTSFAKATNVKWQKNDSYYTASFELNGEVLQALIAEEGTLIATTRNILSTALPINLRIAITKNFSDYWISDLAEYAIGNETVYYLTVENADQKTILQSVGTHDWSVLKKTNR